MSRTKSSSWPHASHEWDIGLLVMVSPMSELATLKLVNRLRHIGVVVL